MKKIQVYLCTLLNELKYEGARAVQSSFSEVKITEWEKAKVRVCKIWTNNFFLFVYNFICYYFCLKMPVQSVDHIVILYNKHVMSTSLLHFNNIKLIRFLLNN